MKPTSSISGNQCFRSTTNKEGPELSPFIRVLTDGEELLFNKGVFSSHFSDCNCCSPANTLQLQTGKISLLW